jgi:hypothetical protein
VLEAGLAGAYVLDRVVMLARGPDRLGILRQRRFEYAVLGVFAVAGLALGALWVAGVSVAGLLPQPGSRGVGVDLVRVFLLANVLVQMLRLQQRLLLRGMRPEWILAGSFALLIAAGTLLLLLPRASALADKPIGFLDALFTATSASCVTGLSVRDGEFKAVPMPEDIIQAGDVLALAGSVLDLARFVGDNS